MKRCFNFSPLCFNTFQQLCVLEKQTKPKEENLPPHTHPNPICTETIYSANLDLLPPSLPFWERQSSPRPASKLCCAPASQYQVQPREVFPTCLEVIGEQRAQLHSETQQNKLMLCMVNILSPASLNFSRLWDVNTSFLWKIMCLQLAELPGQAWPPCGPALLPRSCTQLCRIAPHFIKWLFPTVIITNENQLLFKNNGRDAQLGSVLLHMLHRSAGNFFSGAHNSKGACIPPLPTFHNQPFWFWWAPSGSRGGKRKLGEPTTHSMEDAPEWWG